MLGWILTGSGGHKHDSRRDRRGNRARFWVSSLSVEKRRPLGLTVVVLMYSVSVAEDC